jgi:ABC-type transport system involved in multi-copper enzyme maturation permease subunit
MTTTNPIGTMLPRPAAAAQAPPRGTLLAAVLAVAGFQLRRLFTLPRLAIAALGVLFPAAVLLAVRKTLSGSMDGTVVVILYALIPEALCMLGLLVTMCPAVADELERGTWAHVAVRPHGRRALLLGSFVAAVAWTAAVAILALCLALAVSGMAHPWKRLPLFAGLVGLSCLGRGALFALPAVIVPKRALVASVGVAIVVEYLAGFLPAVVNQLTVSLRLRSLLVQGMGWGRQMPAGMQLLIDPNPVWVQCGAVVFLAGVLLVASVLILDRRQFPPSEEG